MLLEDLLFSLEDYYKKFLYGSKRYSNVYLSEQNFYSILEQLKIKNYDYNAYIGPGTNRNNLISYFTYNYFIFYIFYNFYAYLKHTMPFKNLLENEYYINSLTGSCFFKVLTENERIIKSIIE